RASRIRVAGRAKPVDWRCAAGAGNPESVHTSGAKHNLIAAREIQPDQSVWLRRVCDGQAGARTEQVNPGAIAIRIRRKSGAEIVKVESDGGGAGSPGAASYVKVDCLQLVVGALRDGECLAVTRRAAAAGEAFAHRCLRARIAHCV